MINGTFRLGGDLVSIKIEGNNLIFFDVGTGMVSTIDGLKISKAGVLKEHPDLKNDSDWKLKSINRLKEYIKKIKGDMNKMLYVKDELNKFGYEPLTYTKKGFRPQKFK